MKPEHVKIKEKQYKINTSYKIGLECNDIAQDNNIGDYERSIAIIYKLFGDDGLNDTDNHCKLLELALRYLRQDKECEATNSNEPVTMDFKQDFSYIHASFMSDYHIDLDKTDMHLWTFLDLLNGLTEDCVLNRIRYIREYDTSQIEDAKTRTEIIKQKEKFALKKQKPKLTTKQEEIISKYKKQAGQK